MVGVLEKQRPEQKQKQDWRSVAGFSSSSPPPTTTAVAVLAGAVKEEGETKKKDLVVPRVGGAMPAGRRPNWFHVPAPGGADSSYGAVKESVRELGLATVCEEAQCPNIGECWSGGTGTIMVLGDTCTRGCKFCAVKTDAAPEPPDEQEPWNTAEAVSRWGVNYVVITSVDRDDLPDGGASHFARTVELCKLMKPSLLLECLVSDFAGSAEAAHSLASAPLDVYAHNVETIERLTPFVRDKRANYRQSLRALAEAKRAPRGEFLAQVLDEKVRQFVR